MNINTRWLWVHHFSKAWGGIWTIEVGRWYATINLGRWIIDIGDER